MSDYTTDPEDLAAAAETLRELGYRGLAGAIDAKLRITARSAEEYERMTTHRAELGKLRHGELVELAWRGRPNSDLNYPSWDKDLLIRQILEDEGHIWHPEPE